MQMFGDVHLCNRAQAVIGIVMMARFPLQPAHTSNPTIRSLLLFMHERNENFLQSRHPLCIAVQMCVAHELVFDNRTLASRKTITRLLKLCSQMYMQPELSIDDT